MRTVSTDLTAVARIRGAAVDQFGRHGFGIGLRAIAEAAGVSLGLIRHHFGSKQGLREACDAWVLEEFGRLQAEQSGADDAVRTMLDQLAHIDEYQPSMRYFLQALNAGGPMAQTLVQRLIDGTAASIQRGVEAGNIRPSLDPDGRARLLTMMELGATMLEVALAPPGEDFSVTWSRFVEAATLPGLELYSQGLLADRTMLDAYLDHVHHAPEEVARS